MLNLLFTKKEPLVEITDDDFDKIKFKARIALIDDEEIPHVKRLSADGYNINDYDDIKEIDSFIRKKYHIVVLDIQGIGKEISPNSEGWGILKYLKNESPHTVVVMFTGADWSITKYKDYVDLADDFLGKDIEFLDFKLKLDRAIKKAFSFRYHFEVEKRKIVSSVENAETFEKIEEIIFSYGKNKKKAMKEIRKLTTDSSAIGYIDNFLSIASSIIDLLK